MTFAYLYLLVPSPPQVSVRNPQIDMLLRVEAMMETEGDLRDPVVDTWYDLDMVTEVLDPVLFLQDVKRLKQCVDIFIPQDQHL